MKDWSVVESEFRSWFESSKKTMFSFYGATDYSEALAEASVEFWNGRYKPEMLPKFLEEILFEALKK
jgi:hypothetical protein